MDDEITARNCTTYFVTDPKLFLTFTRPLEDAGLTYMVTGSVASMIYGEPRMTNDIDIVLTLSAEQAPAILHAFPEDVFYCPPLEVLRLESRRLQRGHFNLTHHETGYKADYVSWRYRLDLGLGVCEQAAHYLR